MLKLLGRNTSGNVQKVLFLLEEIKAPYTREDYGRQFNNTATAEYKAMNPTSKVPTLVDGNTTIWESHSILRYIADTHKPELHGTTPAERSQIEPWMDWLLASLNTPYVRVFVDSRQPADKRPATFADHAKAMKDELAMLDSRLQGKKFLALDRLTLADIAIAPITKRCLDFDIGRPKMPALEAWQAGIDARPAFQKAIKT